MKRILTSLIVAATLFSGFAIPSEITVLSKKTVGVEHDVDFRVRVFRLCVSGQEFVQTFAICPKKGSVTSQLEQIYEAVDGEAVPKKCTNR